PYCDSNFQRNLTHREISAPAKNSKISTGGGSQKSGSGRTLRTLDFTNPKLGREIGIINVGKPSFSQPPGNSVPLLRNVQNVIKFTHRRQVVNAVGQDHV